MDSDFDPDSYLASNQAPAQGFDPDAYLAQNAPDEGALMAAGRGAIRNFPGAQQAIAATAPFNPFTEKSNYSDELAQMTSAAKASKAQHPFAYGAGAVGGSLGPLAIPGVGEALAAESVPGMLGANAAVGALGSQSDTDVTKFSRENAADAARAAAIGAGTAGIFRGGGAAFRSLRGALKPAALAEGAEEGLAGQAPSGAARGVPSSPGEDLSSTESVAPKLADVKTQMDLLKDEYNNAWGRFIKAKSEAFQNGTLEDFEKNEAQHPDYLAAEKNASEWYDMAKANPEAANLPQTDAVYKGTMVDPTTGEKIPLFNIISPGHLSQGSTVTEQSLKNMGLKVPEIQMEAPVPTPKAPTPAQAQPGNPLADRVYASQVLRGIGGTTRQLLKVFGRENPMQAATELGEWMDTAGPNGTSLHSLTSHEGDLLGKVDAIHESSGKQIGDMIDQLGSEEGKAIPGTDLTGVKVELQDFADKTADPQTEARIMKLIKTVNNLGNKDLTGFDILQQLKEMTGKQLGKDPEMSQIYGALADRLNKVVDQYGEIIDNPSLRAAYDKAKLDYRNSSRLLPILRYGETKELAGAGGKGFIHNILGTMGNIGASITGIPPTEQLGKNLMLKTAPLARNLANIRAGVGNRLPPAAMLELSNVLNTKYQNKNKQ